MRWYSCGSACGKLGRRVAGTGGIAPYDVDGAVWEVGYAG
jgi:hypothetical protein